MSNDNTATVKDIRFFTAPQPKENGEARRVTFTISSPDKHFTFKVTAVPGQNNVGKTMFLSVMTGPDNESSYSYVGILGEDLTIRPTRKSKVSMDAQSVRALLWVWRNFETLPAGYEVRHSGKCARCGRKLTTPESIDMGVGPVCAAAMGW